MNHPLGRMWEESEQRMFDREVLSRMSMAMYRRLEMYGLVKFENGKLVQTTEDVIWIVGDPKSERRR